jgi:hypothetical protein
MGNRAPQACVVAVDAFERSVALRVPFRFGASTVRSAWQAFARVSLEDRSGRRATGWAADLMMPKWFDKDPGRSQEENVSDLRRSVLDAVAVARTETGPATLHALSRAWRGALATAARTNGLLAGFGPSLIERAAIDALGRMLALSFPGLLRADALGFEIDAEPLGIDAAAFLRRCALPGRVAFRHTVGLVDALTEADADERPEDGLPVSLAEVLDRHRPRWLKIKLAGDTDRDLARLRAIASLVDARLSDYGVTLDGNEQIASTGEALAFWDALEHEPALARLRRSVVYLEQPFPRGLAVDGDVRPLARRVPLVIDESDGDDDAFLRARDLGYTGVSVKSCKGVFRALRNSLRCAAWNGGNPSGCPYFLAGEDLTAQPGVALQQDLALAATLGVPHVERNGHHYATGMQGAGPDEIARFLRAHADLYEPCGEGLRVRVADGLLALGSLDVPGFATGAHPAASDLKPLGG